LLFNQHKTDELVVKPRYSPGVKLCITGLTVVILLVSGGVLYNYGLSMGDVKRLETSHREQDLQNQAEQLEAASESLREALVRV
jgi:hypothetical protein